MKALALLALPALLLPGPASAQATLSPAVTAKLQAAVALIECNDGSERTYLTGLIVASDDLRSFVAAPQRTGLPGSNSFRTCHSPVVHFSDNVARAYPAQQVAPNFGKFLVASSDYVLAVDHPVTRVATLAASAPRTSGDIALVGYDTQSVPPAGTLPNLLVVPGTLQTTFSLNSNINFASPATMDSAVVVDAASGDVLGIADNIGAYSNPQNAPLRLFQLAGPDALTSLLQGMLEPMVPGLAHLPAQRLLAERIASASALPFFLRWPGEARGEYAGFAVVLGATATSTVLISPGVRAVTHSLDGDPFVEVRGRDGAIRMLHATPITTDPGTGMVFLAVPKLDVTIPTFGAPPPMQTTVAMPQVYGNLCTWTIPAPTPEACPLRVYFVPIGPPPGGTSTAIGLTSDTSFYSPGAPVIDLARGSIVALGSAAGWGIPMPIVALKLEPLHVGVSVAIRP